MPTDPLIARGITPLGAGLADTVELMSQMRYRDAAAQEASRRTDIDQQRVSAYTQGLQQQQQATFAEQERAWLGAAVEHLNRAATDPALFEATKRQFVSHPIGQKFLKELGSTPDAITPDNVRQVAAQLAMQGGIAPPAPPPTKPVVEQQGGYSYLWDPSKGVLPNSVQEPQRPQQYGPESFTTEVDADGNILLIGNRGTIRNTGRKGQLKAGGSAGTVTIGPNGETIITPGKTNDVMRTASGFVSRMKAAEKKLGDYMPTQQDYVAANTVMSSGPFVASTANRFLSEAGQKYYQAAADWVRAKLRKESGAVISPEEMQQEIKTYFPVPGDSASVIAQKKQARAQATLALQTQAGGAYTPEAGVTDSALPPEVQALVDQYASGEAQ